MSETNLEDLRRDAMRVLHEARTAHFKDHDMAGAVVMFSGGNDSTILAHAMRHHATHLGHANTGIGIEQTREFVRSVAADWGMPLIEKSPDERDSYERSVIEYGFPGPGHHFKMYQRLKERAFRKMRAELVSNPRKERVLFLSGIRRDESARRAKRPEHSREGSIVWASPLINWTDDDMRMYRHAHPDLPHNAVTDHLHMSGECLCGAFAHAGELEEIRFWYPDVAVKIEALGAKAAANGVAPERCQWGWGAYSGMTDDEIAVIKEELKDTLCSTCVFSPAAATDTKG
jgi:3'-phosphoadenosine 5'-phosphosulfate sulfotransferase (PAPS reductase)/FAD synthetase